MRRLHIMVVEDEANILKFVVSNLKVAGFDVAVATDGLSALEIIEDLALDLVILDLMLPGLDGIEVCRRIREQSEVPILILSARGEERDKVHALNLGADDYLTKPFGIEELLARVRAVLRRARAETLDTGARLLVKGPFTLDPDSRQVAGFHQQVKLTRTEFDVLHCLMRNDGKMIPHNRLLSSVWGPEYRDQTEYLRVYIGRLRQKLEPDPASPVYLITEPGYGYMFRAVGSLS